MLFKIGEVIAFKIIYPWILNVMQQDVCRI